METTFIYSLNDPETGECRYVGKADDPHDRLFGPGGHLYEARNTKKPCHRTNWLNSLLNRGLTPLLEILQEVPETGWKIWERAWIKASRKIGMDLTNSTDGGDAPPNTIESRQKMRMLKLGKPLPKWITELARIANTGNQYRLGKKDSAETKKRKSAARTGEKNPAYGKPGGMLGKKHSAAAIEKTKKAKLLWWANKKGKA